MLPPRRFFDALPACASLLCHHFWPGGRLFLAEEIEGDLTADELIVKVSLYASGKYQERPSCIGHASPIADAQAAIWQARVDLAISDP